MASGPGFSSKGFSSKVYYRFGDFEIDREFFFGLLAILLLLGVIYLKIPIPYISAQKLLFLVIIFLIARAFVPPQLLGYLVFAVLFFYIFSYFFYSFGFLFQLILLIFLLFFLFGLFSRR